jgi:hypothetical protein
MTILRVTATQGSASAVSTAARAAPPEWIGVVAFAVLFAAIVINYVAIIRWGER